MKEENIEFLGKVVKLERSLFKVKLENFDQFVDCTIAGRLRKNDIKIVLGDMVKIEVSPYDVNKGRIVYREK